ncbi:MAG: tripartite tricarboxylate transporter substrate binding protein [Betaproteobacteria bacterium]|nr:tripartite tricarboxylate transporter substrate binding protein [Betaproteobacteria bacterium]
MSVSPARGADAAADYPSRPIRIIVPFQPGGLPDIAARLIGPRLVAAWKHPVVVDNRAGAGGIIGMEIVAKSAADGYTLLMSSPAHATLPAVHAKLPFDAVRDFSGITITSSGAYLLVVPASLGVKTIKELIGFARSRPGQINFGSAGLGTGTHFAAELFNDLARVDAVHVAYKGIPDALTDTVAGRVQYFMPPLASAAGMMKDGRLRGLAASQRVTGYEHIPTFEEAGVQGYTWQAWAGLFAPARTPRPVINKLHAEVSRILVLPEVKQRMATLGADAAPMSTAAFDKMLGEQVALATRLAKKAGIKAQ